MKKVFGLLLMFLVLFIYSCADSSVSENVENQQEKEIEKQGELALADANPSVESIESVQRENSNKSINNIAVDHKASISEVELKGKLSRIPVQGDDEANIYSRVKNGSNIYLIIFHEWWGLNEHIMSEADRWYDELGNANVIAVDLYDGRVATTMEEARRNMQETVRARVRAIIDAVITQLPEDAKVGTLGWSYGGAWALRTALRSGSRTQAAVMYYGWPMEKVEDLLPLNSDLLFIYGSQDPWLDERAVGAFSESMKMAKKVFIPLEFDADHEFVNPSSKYYNKEAAEEANKAALQYLKQRLK